MTLSFFCIFHQMPIDKSSRRIKEVSEQFIIFRSFEGKKLHEDKYLKIILLSSHYLEPFKVQGLRFQKAGHRVVTISTHKSLSKKNLIVTVPLRISNKNIAIR